MSSFGSSFFGKKNAKRPALLKMKGEHNKPLACVCGGGADGVDLGLVYAGSADGAVFCYDLRTQTAGVRVVAARARAEERGSPRPRSVRPDPLGIAAEKEARSAAGRGGRGTTDATRTRTPRARKSTESFVES